MKTLLIVDDEIISRIGIRNIIDWNAKGYDTILEAENGKAALKILRNNKIDLVITDIKMPIMDGTSLLETAQKENIKSFYIILSSYTDYAFVRKALTLGAIDYILKLDLNSEIMNKLIERVAIAQKEDNEKFSSKKTKTINSDTKRELLRQLFYGKKDLNNSKTLVEIESQFSLNKKVFSVLSFDITKKLSGQEKESLILLLDDILKDYSNSQACMTSINEISILFILNSTNTLSKVERVANRISAVIKDYFNINVIMYFSSLKRNILLLNETYLQLQETRNLRNINSESILINYDRCKYNCSKKNYTDILAILTTLPKLQEKRDIQKIVESLEAFIKEIKKGYFINIQDCKFFLKDFNSVVNWIGRTHSIPGYIENIEEDSKTINKIYYYEDMNIYLKNLMQRAKSYCLFAQDSYLVRKVKEKIQLHYSESIVIGNFGKELNVSNSYLSALFKKETGETIKDYLINTRINSAQNLLKNSSLQVQEIARDIGFVNEHYFSTVFKQKTELTPLDYRHGNID